MQKDGRNKRRNTPASVVIPKSCKRSMKWIEEDVIVIVLGMVMWNRTRLGKPVEIGMSADGRNQAR